MRSLREQLHGIVDLGVIIGIGIAFVGMMVVAYLVWLLNDTAVESWTGKGDDWQVINASMRNITTGFDSAINLILVAVTIFILALAISALLLLRGRQ